MPLNAIQFLAWQKIRWTQFYFDVTDLGQKVAVRSHVYKISELKGIDDTKPNNFLVFEKPTLKQEFQLQIVQRL